MTRWQLLTEIRAAMRSPDRLGDLVVLKSELGRTRAFTAIEDKLDAVRGYHPRLDLAALAALPEDTFGHAYARFMRTHSLDLIEVTGNLPAEMVARNAFNVRYGIIHDMTHVLLGFDVSWPGEVGVWAFIGAQNYSRQFNLAGWLSLFVAPLFSPLRVGEAISAWKRGRALARGAKLLITERLEEQLHRPLAEVRAELGIAA